MANVLLIYENVIATVATTESFFRELSGYDNRIDVRFKSISVLTQEDLNWCDTLYMIRPNNAAFGRIARLARESGRTVVFFLDDDLMRLPKGNADIPWRKTGLALAARNSDIIVSSSRRLCEIYANDYGISRMVEIHTAVPKEDIKDHLDHINTRVKVVYAAGTGHKALFDAFIAPVMKRLDERCGDRISLTFMGVRPDVQPSDYSMPIEFIPSMPLQEYRKRIEQENFDIGLAPLTTNDFSKCKYFNKFIEYAMFGIVGLYSDTEPYTFVINDGENGILVGDRPEDWLEAIADAAENPDRTEKCRRGAYDTLLQRFDPKRIMDDFISGIPELVEEHRAGAFSWKGLGRILAGYRISRLGDLIYKTGFYFAQGGLRGVAMGVKRKMHTVRTEKTEKLRRD